MLCNGARLARFHKWKLVSPCLLAIAVRRTGVSSLELPLPRDETALTWDGVVARYLRVRYEDARASLDAKLSNMQSRFLDEFAATSVQHDYVDTATEIRDLLTHPCDRSEWRLVDEAEDHTVVEIPVGRDNGPSNTVPFVATRISLVRNERRWQIDGIYEPCPGCNLIRHCNAGQCMFCEGTGNLVRNEACRKCNGVGRCMDCLGEDVPGWRPAACLHSTHKARKREQHDEP